MNTESEVSRNRRRAIWIPDDLWTKVSDLAVAEDMAASSWIRRTIRKALAELSRKIK